MYSADNESDEAIAGAFRSLASLGFEVVQPPREYKAKRKIIHPSRSIIVRRSLVIRVKAPTIKRTAFVGPDDIELLRLMASNCEHLEEGGRAIREYSDYCTGGDVVGRTAWAGRPEWAQGWDMSGSEIRAAVEKAITGNRLGRRQEALIRAMLEEVEATRASVVPVVIAPECPF